jgi:probable F420-dependent oxidoreductase
MALDPPSLLRRSPSIVRRAGAPFRATLVRVVEISVTIAGLGRLYRGDLRGLLETARVADAAGIDQLVVTDHVVMGPRTDRYPYGSFPMRPDEPWLEPMTTLAWMAGVTRRVRLGTGVLIAPLRPAVLLAKTAATLDVLSGGRLDLGVGVGWQREEYEASGLAFEERWSRLDDTLRACRALWREAPAAFQSPSVSFQEISSFPHPVQPGGIPLWFGVKLTKRNLVRIAELGSGWMPMSSEPDELGTGIAALREAFAAAGRPFEGFGVRAHAPLAFGANRRLDLDATLAGLPALADAGATSVSFALGACVGSVKEIPAFFERVAKAG